MTNKLVLIDGNSILYRAFFALPLLNNDKGVYTNAVYGFTTMLMRILKDEQPTHMLVAFDAGKTTFRHETYQEYKGGRQKTPPELVEQFPVVHELLDAFGIAHYQLPMYEADDIIGTMSYLTDEDWDVTIVSGDKDLLQLVNDRIRVTLTKKGISDVEKYTPAYMQENMGITPDQIIDYKALMGDNSDNIPGVPGVGDKTAVKLLNQFQSLDNVYRHLDEVSGKKLKENLTNHQDSAFMSKDLVTIKRDTPVDITLEDVVYNDYDVQTVNQTFKDLGFKSLLTKVQDGSEDEQDTSGEAFNPIDFEMAETLAPDMLGTSSSLVVEILEDNYHTAPVEGVGIVSEAGKVFVPMEVLKQSDVFKAWAEDETKTKIVFGAKQTLVSLMNHDIHIKGISFDTLLASYLIDPSENHHDIPSIAQRMEIGEVHYDEEVYGKGAKLTRPEQTVLAEHIMRKTNALFHIERDMTEELKNNAQFDLLIDLEMPLALILGEMEHTGVQVDVDRLNDMGKDLKTRLGELANDIYDLAGEQFNVNSPKQLGPILFEKLELPVIKKTKTGYSTAADVLEQLEGEHEIIPKLLLYRQLQKLQSTYIEGLLKVVDDRTHKIHTRYNQALTQTGRLSSIEPNLQNIPIRLEEGRKIRQAFIPSQEDWVMFSADYSQIELRVLAHIAGDDKLIEAFKDNQDIHTQTAMDVFHVKRDDVTDNMRRQSKAVNFGIVYGISDFGLSQSLGITRKEAKTFIERYFESYPGVKEYMDEVVKEAKRNGYVTTLENRRRYLPDITSRNFNRRSFAERTAMNTPIQGSAADIIKQAMIDLRHKLKQENLQSRMLLQVHDELILEAPPNELEQLKNMVPDIMEHTVDLSVPLKVEYAYGPSWFDAK